MKIVKFYQFMQWDGGDRHRPSEPCFSSKEDADEFLGDNTYDHFEEYSYTIYDDVTEYHSTKTQQTRQRALDKLTDIEKVALGLMK
jgi:hypothetical protein